MKFTNEGSITVSASHDQKMATISVTDTGNGMSEEMIQKLYQTYEQREARLTSTSGIGLGLIICRELVELHGGKATVTSVLNEGSTFIFTLPLVKEQVLAEDVQEVALIVDDLEEIPTFEEYTAVNSGRRARVLVVDDDPTNSRIIKMLLEPLYTIITVTSASEALLHIEQNKVDLVISDAMMPNISGYELTQRIRKLYTMSELPVLLLTARSQKGDIYTSFDVGANDYISKPVDSVELLARVKALIDLKQAIHEQLLTEAAWLQAQIQPHFLFNTLNTIASLAEIDTERMIGLLH